MARALRVVYPGGWYHVTARGNERRDIFRDDVDRAHFCGLLGEMIDRFGLKVHAYVLMPNHYHLLLGLARTNLSPAIQWLNVSYSVWFNKRRDRTGHFFQGRFKSIVVDRAAWGLRLSAYIHLNPVRVARRKLSKANRQQSRTGAASEPSAELVRRRIAELRAFPWSSYRAYAGLARGPAWLDCDAVLALGGGAQKERVKNYRHHVEQQIREGLAASPWEELTDRVALGGRDFLRTLREKNRPDATARPKLNLEPVALDTVIAVVETVRAEKWANFKDRHADRGRGLVLHLARKATDLSLAQLAQETGLKQAATVAMAIKRYRLELDRNPAERALAIRAAHLLKVRI